jgi:hypothetical protein
LALVSNLLTECVLLTVDGGLYRGFKPVESLGEWTTGISVLPVDGIVEEETTLRNTTCHYGLSDVTGEGVVSGFGVEACLRNGAGLGSSEETVEVVSDTNIPTAIIRL